MPIDPSAVGATGEPVERSWDSDSCMLYALGVGARNEELAFVTENSSGVELAALATMPVVLSGGGAGVLRQAGSFDPAMVVHGAQRVELHQPLRTSGTVTNTGRITAVWDKGSGAVVEVTVNGVDASGEPLFTTVMSVFIRGEGGFGGERGPSARTELPDREPDHVVADRTRPEQALLYRLNGDRNPLHSDPSFAALAGFDCPILHGLCTYGFAGRALQAGLCGSDPARVQSMDGRFSAPVFPGERLVTRMWVESPGEAVFATYAGEADDERVVIDAGRFTYRP